MGIGSTPFIYACSRGAFDSFDRLLFDSRVDMNIPNDLGYSRLMRAAYYGYIQIVEEMLASLREIQGVEKAMREAKKGWNPLKCVKIVPLLEEYLVKPFDVKNLLRSKLNSQEYGPVSIFVWVVLLADNYFHLKILNNGSEINQQNEATNQKPDVTGRLADKRRFFTVLIKLPMDMQMMICNRVFDLEKDVIRGNLVDMVLKFMVTDKSLK